MPKRCSVVNEKRCVACGTCENECPRGAIRVWKGCYAKVDSTKCIGCGICSRVCPAGVISIMDREMKQGNEKKKTLV